MHDDQFHNDILLMISCNICALLAKRGMSTQQLSKTSGVGMETLTHLTNQVKVLTVPTLQTLSAIAKALDVPLWCIFADDQRDFDKIK